MKSGWLSWLLFCIFIELENTKSAEICEHSGTSYQVRTYEQFLADDMGEKK